MLLKVSLEREGERDREREMAACEGTLQRLLFRACCYSREAKNSLQQSRCCCCRCSGCAAADTCTISKSLYRMLLSRREREKWKGVTDCCIRYLILRSAVSTFVGEQRQQATPPRPPGGPTAISNGRRTNAAASVFFVFVFRLRLLLFFSCFVPSIYTKKFTPCSYTCLVLYILVNNMPGESTSLRGMTYVYDNHTPSTYYIST